MAKETENKKEKNPTIYDVAKLACVSLATASRVMNGIDKVAPDTKERVLAAIKELNYRPSSIAVELASRKNTNVAIVVPEIKYSYVSHVVSGIMEEASEFGYDCLIFTTKNDKKSFTKTISKVISLRPNGIILFNDNLSDDELKELFTFDIPLVTLGVDLKTTSSVSWHYKNQIIDLVNEALKRNKQIYFLQVDGSGRMEHRIIDAICKAYASVSLNFDNIINVPDSYQGTYDVVTQKINEISSGFFISTRDGIVIAALNAALDMNKKVPEDFEFMAMIGTKYSNLIRPKVSSFSIDMKGLGIEGMKVLSEVIEHPDEIITKKLPFKYVKRDSTL